MSGIWLDGWINRSDWDIDINWYKWCKEHHVKLKEPDVHDDSGNERSPDQSLSELKQMAD